MLKRIGVVVLVALLAGCSANVKSAHDSTPMALWAPLKPAAVDAKTINAWMHNPRCDYSQYPLDKGQYLPGVCVKSWVLSVAHLIYQQQFDQLNTYVNAAGLASMDLLRQSPGFQSTVVGKVTLVGEPLMVNQGVSDEGVYTWVMKLPIAVTIPAKGKSSALQLPQILVIGFERNHTSTSNGLEITNLQLRPIGLQRLHHYCRQAMAPYIPVSQLYVDPYSKPIYFDNPVPAQVEISKGNQHLFSQWLPAGPQAISTESFPVGRYSVTITMSGNDGNFLRQYVQVINKR